MVFLLAVRSGLLAAARWSVRRGLLALPAAAHLGTRSVSGGRLGSVLGLQWSMTFGALAAAAAPGAFVGHEVGYIVGLGGAGLIASVLYFVIALGKLTINILNT